MPIQVVMKSADSKLCLKPLFLSYKILPFSKTLETAVSEFLEKPPGLNDPSNVQPRKKKPHLQHGDSALRVARGTVKKNPWEGVPDSIS